MFIRKACRVAVSSGPAAEHSLEKSKVQEFRDVDERKGAATFTLSRQGSNRRSRKTWNEATSQLLAPSRMILGYNPTHEQSPPKAHGRPCTHTHGRLVGPTCVNGNQCGMVRPRATVTPPTLYKFLINHQDGELPTFQNTQTYCHTLGKPKCIQSTGGMWALPNYIYPN